LQCSITREFAVFLLNFNKIISLNQEQTHCDLLQDWIFKNCSNFIRKVKCLPNSFTLYDYSVWDVMLGFCQHYTPITWTNIRGRSIQALCFDSPLESLDIDKPNYLIMHRSPILDTNDWFGADPGLWAVINPAVGCHYFSLGPRLGIRLPSK